MTYPEALKLGIETLSALRDPVNSDPVNSDPRSISLTIRRRDASARSWEVESNYQFVLIQNKAESDA